MKNNFIFIPIIKNIDYFKIIGLQNHKLLIFFKENHEKSVA
jgi:hypothetical protein